MFPNTFPPSASIVPGARGAGNRSEVHKKYDINIKNKIEVLKDGMIRSSRQ